MELLKDKIRNEFNMVENENFELEAAIDALFEIVDNCETFEEIEEMIMNDIEYHSYYTNDCFNSLSKFDELLDFTQYNESYFGFSIFENIFIVASAIFKDLVLNCYNIIEEELKQYFEVDKKHEFIINKFKNRFFNCQSVEKSKLGYNKEYTQKNYEEAIELLTNKNYIEKLVDIEQDFYIYNIKITIKEINDIYNYLLTVN